jgi:hypothetical protein
MDTMTRGWGAGRSSPSRNRSCGLRRIQQCVRPGSADESAAAVGDRGGARGRHPEREPRSLERRLQNGVRLPVAPLPRRRNGVRRRPRSHRQHLCSRGRRPRSHAACRRHRHEQERLRDGSLGSDRRRHRTGRAGAAHLCTAHDLRLPNRRASAHRRPRLVDGDRDDPVLVPVAAVLLRGRRLYRNLRPVPEPSVVVARSRPCAPRPGHGQERHRPRLRALGPDGTSRRARAARVASVSALPRIVGNAQLGGQLVGVRGSWTNTPSTRFPGSRLLPPACSSTAFAVTRRS